MPLQETYSKDMKSARKFRVQTSLRGECRREGGREREGGKGPREWRAAVAVAGAQAAIEKVESYG